jgi:hypothetical protein
LSIYTKLRCCGLLLVLDLQARPRLRSVDFALVRPYWNSGLPGDSGAFNRFFLLSAGTPQVFMDDPIVQMLPTKVARFAPNSGSA